MSQYYDTDVDNRERARTRDKKAKENNFVGTKTEGEKMRNSSSHQGKNEP